jgi:hypothetical protein
MTNIENLKSSYYQTFYNCSKKHYYVLTGTFAAGIFYSCIRNTNIFGRAQFFYHVHELQRTKCQNVISSLGVALIKIRENSIVLKSVGLKNNHAHTMASITLSKKKFPFSNCRIPLLIYPCCTPVHKEKKLLLFVKIFT